MEPAEQGNIDAMESSGPRHAAGLAQQPQLHSSGMQGAGLRAPGSASC
jgi:hypothetical protein